MRRGLCARRDDVVGGAAAAAAACGSRSASGPADPVRVLRILEPKIGVERVCPSMARVATVDQLRREPSPLARLAEVEHTGWHDTVQVTNMAGRVTIVFRTPVLRI